MLAELFVSEGYDVDVAFDGHRGPISVSADAIR